MLEDKGSEEEFLKQIDTMISMDSFWVILQKLIGTMEKVYGIKLQSITTLKL